MENKLLTPQKEHTPSTPDNPKKEVSATLKIKSTLKKLLICLLAVLIFGGGWMIGNYFPFPFHVDFPSTEDKGITLVQLKEIITPAAELISTKYDYSDVGIIDDAIKIADFKLPFTTKKLIYTYNGTILLGIDLESEDFKCENTRETDGEKIVTITLPEVKILAHERDDSSYKYLHEQDNVFNLFDPSELSEDRAKQKKKMEDAVMQNKKLLNTAKTNAQNAIRVLLEDSSIADGYTIRFK